MSNVDPTLQFPSGRTVADLKQAAKRLARDGCTTHTEALDALARENGIDLHWAAAVAVLARSYAGPSRTRRPFGRRRVVRRSCSPARSYTEGAYLSRRANVRYVRGIEPELEQNVRRAVTEYFESPKHVEVLASKHDVPLRLLRSRISRFKYEHQRQIFSRLPERVGPYCASARRKRGPSERT